MSIDRPTTVAANFPAPIHQMALRAALALVVFVAMVAFAARITV
jgi:hypothetical protein